MIDDLPPLRDVIRRYGLSARKSLGQNFLLDLNLTARIARAAGPLDGFEVVEVGPGPGGLTRALLAEGAARVVAIERDGRAVAALREVAERYPGKLSVIEGDALAADMAAMAGRPAKVVANLPYNIATPLLFGWLKAEPWPPWYESLTLLFQREVAERITAAPGTKDYGRLSVFAQWRTRPRILFEIKPQAFTPPPKVTSALVRLDPRPEPPPCRPERLEQVTAAAFGQRRKMLRSSLKALGNAARILAEAGVPPEARAEDVPVDGYAALAQALERARG